MNDLILASHHLQSTDSLPELTIYLAAPPQDSWSDENAQVSLMPTEVALASQIKHLERRREFIVGRQLCRKILGWSVDLGRDDAGMVQWPEGYTGSISHKKGWVAACVVPQSVAGGVGIDIELLDGVAVKHLPRICTEPEREFLDSLAKEDLPPWLLSLIFSFKESLFKCFYPKTRVFLSYHDAQVTDIDIAAQIIVAEILHPYCQRQVVGRFRVLKDAGLILTVV